MSNEIINTMYRQLMTLNRQSLMRGNDFIKIELPVGDEANNTLQVIVKRSAGTEYKFFIRYDAGDDTYSVRFGKIYSGSKFDRKDWGEFFMTEWESGVYAEDLLKFALGYIKGAKTLSYHSIKEEAQGQ